MKKFLCIGISFIILTMLAACGNPFLPKEKEFCNDVKTGAGINAHVPQILTQPRSAVYRVFDLAEFLTVGAYICEKCCGGNLTYQWYSNSIDSNEDGELIEGETNVSFRPNLDFGTFYYYVIITNTITNNGDGGNKTAVVKSNTAQIIANFTGLLYMPPEPDLLPGQTATVTFFTNGGAEIPAELVIFGEMVTRPSDPVRNGFVFDYWYQSDGTPYYFETPVVKNITLRARWVSQADITAMAAKDFVWVSGGTFKMGQNGDGTANNVTPIHDVTLTGYWMSKYQVTQDKWFEVMGTNPSYFHGGTDREPADGEVQGRRPVERINWYDAIEFCNRLSIKEGLTPAYEIERPLGAGWTTDYTLWGPKPTGSSTNNWDRARIVPSSEGYRLPTGAQWEYAAKGGQKSKGYIYSGSDDIDEVAWYTNNSSIDGTSANRRTREVGLLLPNELEIYDMSGNVWGWCFDGWGGYSAVAKIDPAVGFAGVDRLIRGGSWLDTASNTRSVDRDVIYASYWGSFIGLRLARP